MLLFITVGNVELIVLHYDFVIFVINLVVHCKQLFKLDFVVDNIVL